MTTTRESKIVYGNVEVTDEELSSAATRRRVSIMVPEDVLGRLRAMAAEQGIGYQTLTNNILRDATMGTESITARLERVEMQLESLMQHSKPVVHVIPSEGEHYVVGKVLRKGEMNRAISVSPFGQTPRFKKKSVVRKEKQP